METTLKSGFKRSISIFWIVFNSVLILMITALLIGYVFVKINPSYSLGINQSQSETPGLYWMGPLSKKLQKGDFVVFNSPKLGWVYKRSYVLPHEKIIKRIGAVPGEYLFTKKNKIYRCRKNKLTNACHILGVCLKTDPNGNPVYCKIWHGYRIPKNHYYMQSQRVKISLDSRYLGLISRSNMIGGVHLLWGW